MSVQVLSIFMQTILGHETWQIRQKRGIYICWKDQDTGNPLNADLLDSCCPIEQPFRKRHLNSLRIFQIPCNNMSTFCPLAHAHLLTLLPPSSFLRHSRSTQRKLSLQFHLLFSSIVVASHGIKHISNNDLIITIPCISQRV